MPTVNVNVNAISGDTTSFNVNSATVLSNASDGDTGSTFFNSVSNVSLTFGLEDISDVSELSGATLNSAKAVVTAAAGGKGAMEFTVEITNTDSLLVSTDSLGGSSGTQTDFDGDDLNISSFSTDQFNDLFIRYTTTSGTQPVVSRIKLVVDYTAAAIGAGQLSISSGLLNMSSGNITI